MLENFNRRHYWGFRVDPGKWVGGGFYAEVRLTDGEVVTDTIVCSLGNVWFPAFGYLVLTNQRVIFTPYRWPVSLANSHPIHITYAQVTGCRAEIVRDFGNPASFFLPALILDSTAKSELTLRPAAAAESIKAIAADIERMRRMKVA